jgi:hypothetical protein
MLKRLTTVALAVAALHFAACISTLAVGSAFALSDLEGGRTLVGALGQAVVWFNQAVLSQPLKPLSSSGVPWAWGRGYGGLVLNSALWGLAFGLCAVVALRRRRRITRNPQHFRKAKLPALLPEALVAADGEDAE